MFEIEKTLSFNTDELISGGEYDYITRTSQNQGILQETGFVNKENINSAGNWSLGLLQMDFFYRNKPWYAGQFVRKIISKIKLTNNLIKFFTVSLNILKPKLLTLAVRHVEETFLNSKITLPTKNGKINFNFMENFIDELEKEKIQKLEKYLEENGLKNYELTSEEKKVLSDFDNKKIEWGKFKFDNLFKLGNIKNKLSKSDLCKKGTTPIYSSESTNNGIIGYTSKKADFIVDDNNPIYVVFGDHTRSFNIATESFCVADNVKVLTINDKISIKSLFYITSSWKKCIVNKGYSRHWSIAKKVMFNLPIKKGKIDYELIENLISGVQKMVIKNVIKYVENKKS